VRASSNSSSISAAYCAFRLSTSTSVHRSGEEVQISFAAALQSAEFLADFGYALVPLVHFVEQPFSGLQCWKCFGFHSLFFQPRVRSAVLFSGTSISGRHPTLRVSLGWGFINSRRILSSCSSIVLRHPVIFVRRLRLRPIVQFLLREAAIILRSERLRYFVVVEPANCRYAASTAPGPSSGACQW
jgi:hypothetical protein